MKNRMMMIIIIEVKEVWDYPEKKMRMKTQMSQAKITLERGPSYRHPWSLFQLKLLWD